MPKANATTPDRGAGHALFLLKLSRPYFWLVTFWLYLLGSACVYGAVVPFWFIGAKHLQLKWHMALSEADGLMLLPEGISIAVCASWLASSHCARPRRKLAAMAGDYPRSGPRFPVAECNACGQGSHDARAPSPLRSRSPRPLGLSLLPSAPRC